MPAPSRLRATLLGIACVLPAHAAFAADAKAAPSESDQPAVALDDVVVTGTRTPHRLDDSPVEVLRIGREQIRSSGARDLAELLEREGGVTVTPVAGRGTSIEIQGLSSEQVLILVDGRRMIGRINGAIDLSRLRLDSVERIEIVRGPTSALYGADALGGVVNIITRRAGDKPEAQATGRIDADGNSELSARGAYAQGDWRGAGSAGWLNVRPFDLDKSNPGTDGIKDDGRYATADAQWQANSSTDVDFYGAYSIDNTLRTDSGTGGAVYDTRKRIEEIRLGAAPRVRLDDLTSLSFDTYYNRYYDQYLQIQRGDDNVDYEKTRNQLYSGSAQLDRQQGDHRLTGGVEAQYESLAADRLSASGERDRQSLYAQDEFHIPQADALTLVPGLRYDRDSQFGSQVSPKLALRYDVSSDLFLRAGYGRGYRAPDFKQLLLEFDNPAVGYRVIGNPDLRPERGNGVNLGATWTPDARVGASLGLYRNSVRDLIDIVQTSNGSPVIYSYRNVESALLQGVDAQLQLRPLDPLNIGLGYGWLDAKDQETGQRLSGRARNRANLSARWEQPLYALDVRGVWIGKRVYDVELDSGGAPLPAGTSAAYTLLDARVEWLGWHSLTLALGAKNLLNAGDTQYLPIQPRTGYVEIRWNIL